jgi:hypothetical protein
MTKSLLFRAAVHVVRATSPSLLTSDQISSKPRLRAARLTAQLLVLACGVIHAGAQVTIFKSTQVPSVIDTGDTNPVEVGVKFKADSNGSITGLRFYKSRANIGTHVGHIWSASGALLGSATFSGESGSGWQQVNFATPINVTANTIYVASYFAPSGHYSANVNGLLNGINSPPLHALANGVSGSNGVRRYSSKGGFPSIGYNAINYWVDVVYKTSQSTSPSPKLTVGSTSLNFGSVTVNTSSTITLTLTSTGTSALTINSAAITGTGFTVSGATFPLTLNSGQSINLSIKFAPTKTGAVSGQLTISSNSTTGSSVAVPLSGTGVTAASHEVDLYWNAPSNSPDPVAGYHVYRATGTGSYSLLTGLILPTTYVDTNVASGTTYKYMIKSVDASGVESVASNTTTETVP